MAVAKPKIVQPPQPPSLANPGEFDPQADAFVGWFPEGWNALRTSVDFVEQESATAQTKAAQAAVSESSAMASRSAAEASKTVATAKAEEASASAVAATKKADEAAANALSAGTNASTAIKKAGEAAASAATALSNATIARDSAVAADASAAAASGSEVAAAASASEASTHASSAAASATAAASKADKWISGTVYEQGAMVWSPVDFRSYRCMEAGKSTVDPSAHSAHWKKQVGEQADWAATSGEALILNRPNSNYFPSSSSPMPSHLYGHSVAPFGSGFVIFGGYYDPLGGAAVSVTSAVRRYDPNSDTWDVWGSLGYAVGECEVIDSGDWKFFGCGGKMLSFVVTSRAFVYDLWVSSFIEVASMPKPRVGHAATRLNDGQILVCGGGESSGTGTSTVHVYDPVADVWSARSAMPSSRYGHTATTLRNGVVLVCGGYSMNLSWCALYYPSEDRWTGTGGMPGGRRFHSASLLPDGRVLVLGGRDADGQLVSSGAIYSPDAGTWAPASSLPGGRAQHASATLLDGRVLVCGGTTSARDATSDVIFFGPSMI